MNIKTLPAPLTTAPLRWRLAWFVPVVGVLYGAYQILNRWHWTPPALLPLTKLDRMIPLVPWTVWLYLFLAGCIGLFLAVRGRALFIRAMQALVIAYPIDLLIFAVFPTTYPRVDSPGEGWNAAAFNFLFAMDTPASCFPSGHITAPFIAFWALAKENPRARIALWLTFAALAVTILTTKQHYVVDLLGGLATGIFGVWLSARLQSGTFEPAATEGLIPRPRFNLGLINLLRFQRDPLRFLEGITAECGVVASCRLAWHARIIVNDPHLARAILNLPHTSSNKQTRSVAAIHRICGKSVLTADGESWFRLRRVVQPAFHRQQIERHVQTMAELSTAMISEWRRSAVAGEPIEVGGEMRRLTFRFVCKALFSTDPSEEIGRLERCIVIALEETWRSIRSPLDLALRWPTLRRRRFRAALAGINNFVTRVIAQRRAESGLRSDLLSMLLSMQDSDTGEGLSDEEIRNECVTLLIAGYDTTANALAWAIVELSHHAEIADDLVREVGNVLDGRPPNLMDLPKLRLTRAVFLETLRLHPPIWILERNLEAPVVASGWRVPAGTQVLISPYILHRLSRHWTTPETFAPARFVDAATGAEDNAAYLPFGTGPRTCVGKQLALLEGQVFLAVLAQSGRLAPVDAGPIQQDAGISLRPRGKLWMRFEPAPHAAATESDTRVNR